MRYVVIILMLAGSCLAGEKKALYGWPIDTVWIEGNVIKFVGGTNTWRGVSNDMFTASQQVKQLAKDGEICKVYGHTWFTFGFGTRNVVHQPGAITCKFFKAQKVTKTVTEIIPAGSK